MMAMLSSGASKIVCSIEHCLMRRVSLPSCKSTLIEPTLRLLAAIFRLSQASRLTGDKLCVFPWRKDFS